MTFLALLLAVAAPFGAQGTSFDPEEVSQLPVVEQWNRYSPDWVIQAPASNKETLSLAAGTSAEFLQLRPKEAFKIQEVATEKGKGKPLVPAGTILVRAPGALNAACEMLRQPGFERRTCFIDNDLDGRFDSFFRRLDTSLLLMIPAQSPQLYKKLTIKELEGHPAYTVLDEASDMPPIRFRLRYNRTKKRDAGESVNTLSVCMAPYETDLPQGEEYFGRDCLTAGGIFKDRELSYRFSVWGTLVTARALEGENLAIDIARQPGERTIKLSYSSS